MADADSKQKDTYFVAVKVFLEKDGKFFIFKDRFGDWDLPGGRIKNHEFETPLEDVVRRKMSEELGDDIEYKLHKPIIFMRHERIDASSGIPTRIFALGYQASLNRGKPKISSQHTESMWADQKTFEPQKYFKGGWLQGVREYIDLNKNEKVRKYCGAILYNKDNKILLQHRDEGAVRLPGYWGLFGGGIEEGETPEEAIKRELFEEIEYRSNNPKLIINDEHFADDTNAKLVSFIFAERFDETQPIVQHEGQGYGWFTIPEIEKLKITEHRREQLPKIQEFLDTL